MQNATATAFGQLRDVSADSRRNKKTRWRTAA
jgi:hypothetical protein